MSGNGSGSGRRFYRQLLLQALDLLFGHKCVRCGEPIDMALPSTDPMGPTFDHVVERCLQGRDDIENIRLAHLRCNSLAGGNLNRGTGTGGTRRVDRRPSYRDRAARPSPDQAGLW